MCNNSILHYDILHFFNHLLRRRVVRLDFLQFVTSFSITVNKQNNVDWSNHHNALVIDQSKQEIELHCSNWLNEWETFYSFLIDLMAKSKSIVECPDWFRSVNLLWLVTFVYHCIKYTNTNFGLYWQVTIKMQKLLCFFFSWTSIIVDETVFFINK